MEIRVFRFPESEVFGNFGHRQILTFMDGLQNCFEIVLIHIPASF